MSSDVTSAAYSHSCRVGFDVAKAQQRLPGIVSVADRDAVRQLAAQQDDPAMPAPAMQSQACLFALPTLPGIRPVGCGASRGSRSRFTFAVMRRRNRYVRSFCSARDITRSMPQDFVAAQQRRTARWTEMIQQRPQSVRGVRDVILVARQNIDAQHQAQAGQHVGVVGVRWPAGFGRIVADLGAFLMPVERLHRAVHVQHPGFAQQRAVQ